MTDIEIIKKLMEHYKMRSARAFASFLGLKYPQTLYDVLKGRNGISKDFAETIIAKCLEINSVWIKTGEGKMLRTDINNDNQENNQENNQPENQQTQEKKQMEEKERIGILEEALEIMKRELHDKQRTIDQLAEANRELISYVTGSQLAKKKEAI